MRKPPVRLFSLGIGVMLAVVMAACGNSTTGGGTTPTPKLIKVGLVTDTGGLNDRSFNHLAALGLAKAASTGNICSSLTCAGQLGVQGDVTESHANSDYVPNLQNYATRGYDLVIGVGFLMAESIGTVSGNFPANHFSDPTKCAGVADNQIASGADILFQVAGGCGNGVLTEAGKAGIWSIGVDADQGGVDKSVIASALKRVDVATYTAIKSVKDNAFKSGVTLFGLANDGVGYQADNGTLPADVMTALTDMTSKIKSGAVTVPDTVP